MVDDILKELTQKRRALHEEFRSIETQEDIDRLEKGWEEYHQQVEALKDIPNIDDTLEEDKIKLNIMLGKCQTQEDFMVLREWWDDRHPHIIPHYNITIEEFERHFGFVSHEDFLRKHFGDTPIPGIDYEVSPLPDEHKAYEVENFQDQEYEGEDREQEEFIEQCRRELAARVIELRNKQQ